MMNRFSKTRTLALVAAVLAIGPLAGCVGNAPGTIQVGDTALVRYEAFDLATGEPVENGTAAVTVGQPTELGSHVGPALLGLRAGDRVSVESRDDAARRFTQERTAPRELWRTPSTVTAPMQEFGLRQTPQVGATLDYFGFSAVVTQVSGTTVVVELFAPVPPRQELPSLGLAQVYSIEGEEAVLTVGILPDPQPFTIERPLANYLLDPGTYRAREYRGSMVVFDYTPALSAGLLGRDVRFELTVVSVEESRERYAPVEDEYGHRYSPIVTKPDGPTPRP